MTMLHEWQGHRGFTDDQIAGYLGVCRQTWVKWRDGKSPITHEKLIAALNIMRVPKSAAMEILMKGLKS